MRCQLLLTLFANAAALPIRGKEVIALKSIDSVRDTKTVCRNRFGFRLVASGLCALLCACALAQPAYAWVPTDISIGVSSTPLESCGIEVTDLDGNVVKNSVTLQLACQDRYAFVLSSERAASAVCCRIELGAEAVNYLIIPPESEIVLDLTAAAGTKVKFSAFLGTPPKDAEEIDVEEGNTVVTLEGKRSSQLRACLEFCRTPYIICTVPQGGRLQDIASHYGVAPEDILRYNGVDSVAIGDEIEIPNPAETTPFVPSGVYTVASGDTLQRIAQDFGITLQELRWANPGVSNDIYPGQRLAIPVPKTEPAPAESTEPAVVEPAEAEAAESDMPQQMQTDDGTVSVNGIPIYYQNDYPDVRYGSGTVETSGCSITSLAMIATRMTGHKYLPDELADYFGGYAENNIRRLEYGAEKLQLSFRRAENADYVWPALEEGKIALVLMNEESIFTSSQHFIILAGMSEEGKILVIDSNKDNYSNPQLANAFVNGFTRSDILLGYSGAWIFDPDAMPEEPFIYSEPRLDRTHENYPGVSLTTEEWDLLAKLIWAEARGECPEGQQAVAEVVLNRLVSDCFADNISDVIYAQGQFHSVELNKLEEATPWQAQYQAIDRALHGSPVLDQSVFFFATQVFDEEVFKTIGGHTFYY